MFFSYRIIVRNKFLSQAYKKCCLSYDDLLQVVASVDEELVPDLQDHFLPCLYLSICDS